MSSCDKLDTKTADSYISNYVKTTITGVVYDESHNLLQDVEVTAYGRVKKTDMNGVFVFEDLMVPKSKCFIVVKKDNYFAVMRSRTPIINDVTRLDAHLISYNGVVAETHIFSTGAASLVALSDGSSIDFTGSSFIDKYGNAYNGQITLRTAVLDASGEDYSRRVPGGDQSGVDNGEEMFLDTRTGIMIELTDGSGNALNLASSSTALMKALIPPALQGTSPGNIPMYYASTSSPNNNRDGDADENNNEYEMTLGHFSFWSTQIANPDFGIINCRVIDANNIPLVGVRVQVGNAYGITGNNGAFRMKVPTGMAMDVAVRSADFFGFSALSNESAWSNGESRFVELQLPNLDHAKGIIVDCEGNPLAANVSLAWSAYVSNTFTNNGIFDLPFSVGSNYQLHVITASVDTFMSVNLQSGVNNLGDISICSEPFVPSVMNTVRVDSAGTGVIFNYSSFYSSEDGHLYRDPVSLDPTKTFISVSGNDGDFQLDLMGVYSVGTYDINSDGLSCYFMSNSPSNSYQIESGTVTITQYGNVDGIIKGSVIGTTTYNDDVTINFEVHRSADVVVN